MPDRMLSSRIRKMCWSCTAFLIRCNSFALNCSSVFLQVVLEGKLQPMSLNRFLISILFTCKKISADKNALVTFSTTSVLLLLKNVCKVCRIISLDLLPNAFLYFYDFQQQSASCKKLYSGINCNIIRCWDFS